MPRACRTQPAATLCFCTHVRLENVVGAQKKKAVDKTVDGELGCVTPYIICPGGAWSQADLDFQASQVPPLNPTEH